MLPIILALGALAIQVEPSHAPPSATWVQEPDSYRGVKWGTTLAEARALVDFGFCMCRKDAVSENAACDSKPQKDPAKIPAERSCMSSLTIGSAQVKDILLFAQDQLAGVLMSFPTENYSGLRAVFVEKYGAPTATQETPYSTRGGLKATNETLRWNGSRLDINLARFGNKISEGTGSLLTPAILEVWERRKEEEKKKGAKAF